MSFTLSRIGSCIADGVDGNFVFEIRNSKNSDRGDFDLVNNETGEELNVKCSWPAWKFSCGNQKFLMRKRFWPILGSKFAVENASGESVLEIRGEAGDWKYTVNSNGAELATVVQWAQPVECGWTHISRLPLIKYYELKFLNNKQKLLVVAAVLSILRYYNWGDGDA